MIVDVGNSTGSSITTTIDPKALPAKNLRRGGGPAFDVTPYTTTTYINPKNFLFYAILLVDKQIILCRIIVSPQTENSNV